MFTDTFTLNIDLWLVNAAVQWYMLNTTQWSTTMIVIIISNSTFLANQYSQIICTLIKMKWNTNLLYNFSCYEQDTHNETWIRHLVFNMCGKCKLFPLSTTGCLQRKYIIITVEAIHCNSDSHGSLSSTWYSRNHPQFSSTACSQSETSLCNKHSKCISTVVFQCSYLVI